MLVPHVEGKAEGAVQVPPSTLHRASGPSPTLTQTPAAPPKPPRRTPAARAAVRQVAPSSIDTSGSPDAAMNRPWPYIMLPKLWPVSVVVQVTPSVERLMTPGSPHPQLATK